MEIVINPAFLALVPMVVALVSLMKNYIDSYWAPLMSLVFGLGGALIASGSLGLSWSEVFISGLMVGLMASGAYSGVKALTK